MEDKVNGNAFADIVERVTRKFAPKAMDPPRVDDSVVESYAARMQRIGYEMTVESVSVLAEYLKGYNIWLCGNVGVGKTYFFECMSRIRRASGMGPIVKLSMIETQGWDMDRAREWVEAYEGDDVLIDDVGTEPIMKSWGQEAELFPYLLEKRMQLFGKRTHMTSNLGPGDIKKRYGERVIDRFVQVFKMIQFKARKSRRKQVAWAPSLNGEGVL